MGSLQPDTQATLFWEHPTLLEPLLPWLHQLLGLMFEDDQLQAAIVEDIIMSSLVPFGLDEDVLVRLLRLFLPKRTATLVNDLFDAVERLCSRESHRLLGLVNARAVGAWEDSTVAPLSPTAFQEGSPVPSPGPSGSPARHNVDELPSTSTAAIAGDLGSTPSALISIPRE